MPKAVRMIATVVLLSAMGAAALAQSAPPAPSELIGYVVDQSGAIVPGAHVVLKSGTRLIDATTADKAGHFSFKGKTGTYDLAVTARGFRPLALTDVTLPSEPPVRLTLVVGQNECGICVTIVEPLPTEAAVSSTLVSKEPAPPSPPAEVLKDSKSTWEYGALVQGGNGLQDRTDFRFLMVGAHLGRILTSDFGTDLFKGNFEYAVEVFPLWQSYTPKFQRISCVEVPVPVDSEDNPGTQCTQPYTVGGTYTGASITPIILRYNFTHGKRFVPWIQAAGGVVWTNHKYPAVGDLDPTDPTQTGPAADTSVWNFTPQGGIGAHYFLNPRHSLDVGINGVHISSASLGDKNPGVNASVQVSVGYTWWK